MNIKPKDNMNKITETKNNQVNTKPLLNMAEVNNASFKSEFSQITKLNSLEKLNLPEVEENKYEQKDIQYMDSIKSGLDLSKNKSSSVSNYTTEIAKSGTKNKEEVDKAFHSLHQFNAQPQQLDIATVEDKKNVEAITGKDDFRMKNLQDLQPLNISEKQVREFTLEDRELAETIKEVDSFKASKEKALITNPIENAKPSKALVSLENKGVVNEKLSMPMLDNDLKIDKTQQTANISEPKNMLKQVDIEQMYEQVNTMLEQVGLSNSSTEKKVSKSTNAILNFIDNNLKTESTDKSKNNKAGKISKSGKAESAKDTKEKGINITEDDANFFLKLTKNEEIALQGLQQDGTKAVLDMADKQVQQSAKVSKKLLDALADAQKNNKSVRINFDKDVSVIIKVNKDGLVSADFLPGDKAVEQAIKMMLPSLRQRFDEEGVNYKELSYRQAKDENKSKRENKEQRDE